MKARCLVTCKALSMELSGLFFVPFDWKIKGSIMGLMHAIASFAISLFNNVLLPSTWCNKGVENERKNLEVDDVLAALPQDVSELIFMKLHFVDYVRLSAVSKSWRSIAVAARQGVNFFSSPQLPWLVLSSTKGDFPDGHHGFFSLYHGKIFTLKLPEMGGGARYCGSSFGWLIMANMVEDNFLLHPFSRLQIQLPSQRTLPSFGVISIFPTNKSIPRTDKREDALYIRKVILKSPPISFSSTSHAAENCFIVAIYALHRLCFCRPGDETWTLFQWEEPNLFEDIRWYNDRLYGIDKDFNLTILELEGSDPRGTKIDLPCPVGHDRYRQHFGFYNYLVESLGGELLLVVRCRRYPQDDNDPSNVLNPPKTFRFDVFKLGELIGGPCWIKVENLGDEMLFVGTGGGISVPATDFSSGLFKGNCIYFTDDNFTALRYIRRSKGCHDVGVFSLEDNSIRSFFPTDSHSPCCPPIWFVPR